MILVSRIRLIFHLSLIGLVAILAMSSSLVCAEPSRLNVDEVRAHALYSYAVTHLISHHYDEALSAFLQAGRLDISDPEPRLKAAGILLAARKGSEAGKLMEEARNDFPEAPRVRALLAVAYQQQGRVDEAIEEYQQVLELGPPDAPTILALSSLYLEQGKPDQARKVLEEGAGKFPQQSSFPLKIGALLLDQKNNEEAIKYLYRALSLEPDSAPARSLLGWALYQEGRVAEAVIEYEAALRAGAQPAPGICEQLARIYLAEGRYNMAAGKIRQLLKDLPDSAEGYSLLGSAEYLRGDFEAARQALEKALTLGGDKASILTALGMVYEKLGRFNDTIKVLEEAIVAAPSEPGAYNDLGYFYAERGIKLDEAEELILRALEFSPTEPAFIDSLGWVYYARGEYQRALEQLERAVDLAPEEPEILDHLGDVQFRLGSLEAAREAWSKALELSHPNPDIIKNKLAEGLPPLKDSETR